MEGVLMLIKYVGRVVVFCSMCTCGLAMSVDDAKGCQKTLVTKDNVVEVIKNIEQFCRLLVDRFGGFESVCDENSKCAYEIVQYIKDNGCIEVVTKGKHLDQSGRSPLIMAAQYGRICLAQAFLLLGAGIDEVDNGKRTSLHRAVMMTWDRSLDPMPMLKFLINHGANPFLKDDKGETPAQLARTNGFEKAAAYLVEQEEACTKEMGMESALVTRLLQYAELDGSDDDCKT